MADLDCSSFESALESTAAVLGVLPGLLLDQLRDFDVSALPESERRQHAYAHLLVRHVTGVDRLALPTPERITWFHATRVPPHIDFAEGLLPLRSVHEPIKTYLAQLDKELPSKAERKSRHSPGLGAGLKLHSGMGEGPFAFLVREAILRCHELGNGDYLGCPEIVDDLCDCDESLREAYCAATEPCLVVFQGVGMQRPDTVAAALNYLHFVSRNEKLTLECNTCFDGEGRPIPLAAIVRIERGATLQAECDAAKHQKRNRL